MRAWRGCADGRAAGPGPGSRRTRPARTALGRGATRTHSCGRRRTAAGRKKTPDLLKQLRALLADSLAGDPMGRRRPRTHRRLRQIAHALADWGLSISANTVRRLLDPFGIALRGNR